MIKEFESIGHKYLYLKDWQMSEVENKSTFPVDDESQMYQIISNVDLSSTAYFLWENNNLAVK